MHALNYLAQIVAALTCVVGFSLFILGTRQLYLNVAKVSEYNDICGLL